MCKYKQIISLTMCAALLGACAMTKDDGAIVDSISVEMTNDLLTEMDTLYSMMDTTELSLRDAASYPALDSAVITPQLVNEDDITKKIAITVCNLLDGYGNGLGTYTGTEELSIGRTTTALWHTAPVELTWDMSREGVFTASEQTHALAALVKRELESGRMPHAIYYADEVSKTATQIFGDDARVTHQDIAPYYYYAKEKAYILMEEIKPETIIIPQILSYEKTADGYKTEVILTELRDGNLEYNGEKIDKNNFTQMTENAQRLRYTFRENGERLILVTLEPWRPGQS